MKKLTVILLSVLLIASLCSVSAFADDDGGSAGVILENTDYGGNWVVEDGVYVCQERVEWPSFGVYALGNTTEKMKLYAEFTISAKANESMGNGGDQGFLLGVSDTDGNGKIEENSDYYYLIGIGAAESGGFFGVEKNSARWGDWGATNRLTGFVEGQVIGVTVIYDPEEGTIDMYVTEFDDDGNPSCDGEPWLEYTDPGEPLEGRGYAICSKVTGGEYKNVSAVFGDDATPPEPVGQEDDEDPDDGDDTPDTPTHSDPTPVTPIDDQPEDTTGDNNETTTTGKKSGCGGVIGTAAGVASIIAIVGSAALIRRKKED